ncbi:MAG: NAD(+)/NADH kinase [Epulopiscium sp.]|nr:NAD(+)/NADH kinase [Candidatus Epulonipiscium sp.]HOQ16384.1 NAD(+)/NADH kinase [Defluviitaleaceae bacterium]HPT75800.1 NAD(+)/NADH kinase [Defluviitaleaceae bacterium]
MKKAGLIVNIKKDINLDSSIKIMDWLMQRNCLVYIPENLAKILEKPHLSKKEEEIYQDSDFIVVLGGDGTFLSAARKAAIYDTPILGINLGTLGFLAEVEKASSLQALEKVLAGNYSIEKRMMLEVKVKDCKKNNQQKLICLNDIGVTRSSLSRIINLKVYINNQFVDYYSADGIIVSTPTGSTAYNLSAGGPILDPNSKMMVITPICPHSLSARSIVVSDEDYIEIEICENHNCDIILTIDGQLGYQLDNHDIIQVTKSTYMTKIIKTSDYNFYDILRKKIVGIRK